MGKHLDSNGRFRSDKFDWLKPDYIALSFKDPAAREALAIFCQQTKDKELAMDILHRIDTLVGEESQQRRLF